MRDSLVGLAYWESSHRGGLDVYEVPVADWESPVPQMWVAPATDTIDTLPGIRTILHKHQDGTRVSLDTTTGVRLRYEGPSSENPFAATLVIEDLPQEDPVLPF